MIRLVLGLWRILMFATVAGYEKTATGEGSAFPGRVLSFGDVVIGPPRPRCGARPPRLPRASGDVPAMCRARGADLGRPAPGVVGARCRRSLLFRSGAGRRLPGRCGGTSGCRALPR